MKSKAITASIILTSFILVGCDLSSANTPQVAYRTFELYRESDGIMPTQIESDIPNDYSCLELNNESISKNLNGDDIWLFYELLDGSTNKVFTLQSEYDILIDEKEVQKEDYVEELSVKYFCVSPESALNNELEKTHSNFSDSAIMDRYLELYNQE